MPETVNLFDQDRDFWATYQKGRPRVPASFYQRFYDYHASRGGTFGTVHDAGAGNGMYSFELAKKFDKVIVSDLAFKSLDVAKTLLAEAAAPNNDNDHASKFEFRLEDIEHSGVAPGSVDAIFVCNAIHFTNLEAAVKALARQLKPGGTLFIASNGWVKYGNTAVQQTWNAMLDSALTDLTAHERTSAHFSHTLTNMSRGYDSVPVPESEFEPGATRVNLNAQGDPDAFLFTPVVSDYPWQSRVGPNDKVEEAEDREWYFEAGIDEFKNTWSSYSMSLTPEEDEKNFAEVDRILDGGKCKARWLVTMILATKK